MPFPFKNEFTGIYDKNNMPINEGVRVKIIDKNIIGRVGYSVRRAAFRVYFEYKKPQEQKTYSIANSGNNVNSNLEIIQ